jgi:nicotinamidase-related amidase
MVRVSEVLILIDVQKAFHDGSWGNRNNLDAEKNIERLLNYFRNQEKEVIHIKHVSDKSNSRFYEKEAQAFLYENKLGEKIIEKEVNSAFIGTDLHEYLQNHHYQHLTIVGISLPHCVSTTVRMAQNLGYEVDLIEDATVTFDLENVDGSVLEAKDVHTYNIAALNNEFATIHTTDNYLNR